LKIKVKLPKMDDNMDVEMINDEDELESGQGSDNEDGEVYLPKVKLAEGKKIFFKT
jgi:hypothetical protein